MSSTANARGKQMTYNNEGQKGHHTRGHSMTMMMTPQMKGVLTTPGGHSMAFAE